MSSMFSQDTAAASPAPGGAPIDPNGPDAGGMYQGDLTQSAAYAIMQRAPAVAKAIGSAMLHGGQAAARFVANQPGPSPIQPTLETGGMFAAPNIPQPDFTVEGDDGSDADAAPPASSSPSMMASAQAAEPPAQSADVSRETSTGAPGITPPSMAPEVSADIPQPSFTVASADAAPANMSQPAALPAAASAPAPANPDAQATTAAAQAYISKLQDSMKPLPAETPDAKHQRLKDALFAGGMAMMAASGQRGASMWGSLGQGGLAGLATYKGEALQAKQQAQNEQARETGIAGQVYGVQQGQAASALEGRKVATGETTAAAAAQRANTAEAAEQANAKARASEAANRGAMLQIEVNKANEEMADAAAKRNSSVSALYDQANPNATPQKRAADLLEITTQKNAIAQERVRSTAINNLRTKDPMFNMKDPDDQETAIQNEMRLIGAQTGAAQPQPTPKTAPVAGFVTPDGKYKFKGGANIQANWQQLQ